MYLVDEVQRLYSPGFNSVLNYHWFKLTLMGALTRVFHELVVEGLRTRIRTSTRIRTRTRTGTRTRVRTRTRTWIGLGPEPGPGTTQNIYFKFTQPGIQLSLTYICIFQVYLTRHQDQDQDQDQKLDQDPDQNQDQYQDHTRTRTRTRTKIFSSSLPNQASNCHHPLYIHISSLLNKASN